MNKICTTIEQSKKLIELGIDINTADMWYPPSLIEYGVVKKWWKNPTIIEDIEHSQFKKEYYIPCWSLSALLGLMPIINDSTYEMFGTLDGGALISHKELTCVMFQEDNPLDAAFEMICWLKENNKI